MRKPPEEDITGLLLAWGGGDKLALETLMPLIYQELRRLAHRQMRRERSGDTLQTTALVNEAYMRLVDCERVHARDAGLADAYQRLSGWNALAPNEGFPRAKAAV